MAKERILITNDDGVNARGLRALIDVAREFGDVIVVAPERGMSGMSHSITMYEPLFVRNVKSEAGEEIYACSGTPVDCMKLAMDAIIKEQPTLILSGINHGANTNSSVMYSGTMGGAIEGSTYQIPSIGLSHISHNTESDLTSAIHYAREVIKMVLEKNKNSSLCLNVNVPDLPLSNIKGVKFCRQTKGYWREDFQKRSTPHGKDYYWLVGSFVNSEIDAEDTDEWAISHGYVSIVPVMTDMTDYIQLEDFKEW